MVTNFGHVTKAIVVELGTDKNQGKVKVRIPIFHGPPTVDHLPEEASKYWLEDENLPYADILYPLGSDTSSSEILSPGEVVYVMFTSTDYRRPLVIGTTGGFL